MACRDTPHFLCRLGCSSLLSKHLLHAIHDSESSTTGVNEKKGGTSFSSDEGNMCLILQSSTRGLLEVHVFASV